MTLASIRQAFAHYQQDVVAGCKAAVEEGGGIWVGVQECEGMLYSLALFNSRRTGSTLALKTTEITPELVRSHIRKHEALWKRKS